MWGIPSINGPKPSEWFLSSFDHLEGPGGIRRLYGRTGEDQRERREDRSGDTVNRAVSDIRQRRSVMQRTVVVIAFALEIGLSAPAAAQEWMEFNHIEAKTDSVL